MRDRYGQAGVDLVVLLYRLAREGDFSTVAAAQHWAAHESEEALRYRVLKITDTGVKDIEPRRLSETLKMDKGPVPAGLVKSFLQLWAPRHSRGASHTRRIAEELTRLRRAVVTAAGQTAATADVVKPKSGTPAKAGQIAHLKDRLLQVQEDLIQTQHNEARFRELSSFLFVALTRLQTTHQRLSRERDELLVRAEAAEIAARVVDDARTAGEQLTRAEQQLDQARSRAEEAEKLVQALQTRYRALLTRLHELEETTELRPPAATLATAASTDLPPQGSLADQEAVLDRVEDLLNEGDQYLARTRDRLVNDEDTTGELHVRVVPDRASGDNPDNSSTWLLRDEPVLWPSVDPGDQDWAPSSPNDQVLSWQDNRGASVPEATTDAELTSSTTMPPWTTAGVIDDLHNDVAPVQPAPSGWRRAVRALIGGRFDPGRPAVLAHHQELITRVTQPLGGTYSIAVLSLKGGVGKTTVTACLGATLASMREGRVAAVDVDPDRGTLALKVPKETTATVRHLLRDAMRISDYRDVRAYTSRSSSGLEVLASEQDPAISETFSDQDYLKISELLKRHYEILLADCGTGLTHSAMKGVLDQADSLVIVSSGSVDGAQTSAATLDWLQANGRRDLVANSVAVINSVRPGSGVDLDRLTAHFAQRCRTVVRIPFDQHLEEGDEIEMDKLAPATRLALLELAATIADIFPSPALSAYTPDTRDHHLLRGPQPDQTIGMRLETEPTSTTIPTGTVPWPEKIQMLERALAHRMVTTREFNEIRNWLLDTTDSTEVHTVSPGIQNLITRFARTIWRPGAVFADPPLRSPVQGEPLPKALPEFAPTTQDPTGGRGLTWQHLLTRLDSDLGHGVINADDYRFLRDEVLSRATQGGSFLLDEFLDSLGRRYAQGGISLEEIDRRKSWTLRTFPK